jgi:hypothetical protein
MALSMELHLVARPNCTTWVAATEVCGTERDERQLGKGFRTTPSLVYRRLRDAHRLIGSYLFHSRQLL